MVFGALAPSPDSEADQAVSAGLTLWVGLEQGGEAHMGRGGNPPTDRAGSVPKH